MSVCIHTLISSFSSAVHLTAELLFCGQLISVNCLSLQMSSSWYSWQSVAKYHSFQLFYWKLNKMSVMHRALVYLNICFICYHLYLLLKNAYVQLYHIDILWVLRMCRYITLTSFAYCACAAISHWHPLSTAYMQLYHTDILWLLCMCSYITSISIEYCILYM